MERRDPCKAVLAAGLSMAALLLSCHVAVVQGATPGPVHGTDVYVSPCPVPPEGSYKLWSDTATWPNKVVPGVGAKKGINVTIPCGVAVLLDLPELDLGILRIQGHLRFKDSPSLPKIYVRARHVLVEGKLSIGTPAQHFAQRAAIELTPSPARAPLLFTSFAPASPAFPRDLGHKAFAVVGGQVDLHGMPGGSMTPSWCQLKKTAKVNDVSILVDNPLAASWPIGGLVVVASTDYSYLESEQRVIKAVATTSQGVVLTLNSPLRYNHQGVLVADGMGGSVDQRGEVLLLTRHILITGTDEPEPYRLDGGHFIIYQTAIPQYIEGVEFYKLGKQGSLGRYSIHFHVVGRTPNSVCRKNSIHQSKQRCIVVHATHQLQVERNVAFNTSGHCFALEEGGEQNNTFLANVGVSTLPAINLIPGFTDNAPSTLWISAPSNTFLYNRAVGSLDSGIWLEARTKVRGMTLDIPELASIRPSSTPLLKFIGNVAHSCHAMGMKTYPDGYKPPKPLPGNEGSHFKDCLIYKNAVQGVFVHLTGSIIISGTFADNFNSIVLLESYAVTIKNSRFIGRTANFGTPEGCYDVDKRGWYLKCRPISGCQMPLPRGTPGRTQSGFLTDIFAGVAISQERKMNNHLSPNQIMASNFSNFNYECSRPGTTAGIIVIPTAFVPGDSFNPHFSVSGLKFFTNSNPVWFPPQVSFTLPSNVSRNSGEVSSRYVIQDLDGSIMGKPGSLVANNPNLTKPGTNACKFLPTSNAFACEGSCYRSLRIFYLEPGFQNKKANTNKVGDFSYLRVTRISDGKVLESQGNLNDMRNSGTVPERIFTMNLLAGQTYVIAVVPSKANPSFNPALLKLFYLDAPNSCTVPLSVRIQPPSNTSMQYFAQEDSLTGFWRMCNGGTPRPVNSDLAQYSFTCVNAKAFLEVLLPTYYDQKITILAKTSSQTCPSYITCSLLWDREAGWLWDASGLNRPGFQLPNSSTTNFNKTGIPPFGYNNVANGFYKLPKPSPSLVTYYFRKTFSVADPACFASLYLQLFVKDGCVLYLNGAEFFRYNMPPGPVNNSTLAAQAGQWRTWTSFTLAAPPALRAGLATFAAEVHVTSARSAQVSFDARLFARRRAVCGGAATP